MSRVPDLLVEQLALGELSPKRAAELRARLQAERGGLERLAAIELENSAILQALPPRRVAADPEQ